MKEQILKLREEGKTYKQIQDILGCSKGTISYHCGNGQKEKTNKRRKKRMENPLIKKVDNFRHRPQKNIDEALRRFQKRDSNRKINKNIEKTFSWKDVIEKFGENTRCYLSGEPINLYENNYQLDHIIPSAIGGDNSIDNLGILHEKVNRMKSDMTPEELMDWCKLILENNGYKIIRL